ncbi:uncharacterized protein LOC111591780 [Ceratitis capitata]|uniref:uncharacterized protein LOC111591780 n=1 Tax=Ceratitis capitata TaxID=7213 RepID=UPI000C6C47E2|nr:uncharacterized protein LOC111591780 [Ceratitis capitata]
MATFVNLVIVYPSLSSRGMKVGVCLCQLEVRRLEEKSTQRRASLGCKHATTPTDLTPKISDVTMAPNGRNESYATDSFIFGSLICNNDTHRHSNLQQGEMPIIWS